MKTTKLLGAAALVVLIAGSSTVINAQRSQRSQRSVRTSRPASTRSVVGRGLGGALFRVFWPPKIAEAPTIRRRQPPARPNNGPR